MTDAEAKPQARERPAGSGAGLLTLGGLAAAFGLASCCALPLLLGTLGLGTAWLAGVAVFSVGHRGILLAIGAIGLIGGAGLLWRQQRAAATCGPDGVCTPPAVRVLTLIGLLIGAGLLWAGYIYA